MAPKCWFAGAHTSCQTSRLSSKTDPPFPFRYPTRRRVLCDLPAPTPTTNGPTWLYGKDTTIPAPETTAAQNAAPAKDAAVPPTAATKIVKKILKKGHFDEKVGTKSTANPAKKHEVKQKKTL